MTRSTRLPAAIVAAVLIAAACSPATPDGIDDSAPPTQADSPAPAAAASTDGTTTTQLDITGGLVANPITNRDILPIELEIMPLRGATGVYEGFVATGAEREDNDVAALRTPAPRDETQDIVRYGRLDGYRTVLRPARVSATGALAIDTWVVMFADAAGASGYLADYVRDIVKDEDVGHGGDLRVVGARDFVVEEVGDEAFGLVLDLATPHTSSRFEETLVAFRVGRLLAFASVLRREPSDVRVQLLDLAVQFEQRIIDVLDGVVRPAETTGTAQIGAFRFVYEQSLIQEFLMVVYPDDLPDLGESDDPTPSTPGNTLPGVPGTTTSTSGATTTTAAATTSTTVAGGGPGPGDGESTTTSSTTTTTLLVPTSTVAIVESDGVVVGDDLDCNVTFITDFGLERSRYVVVGNDAWRSTEGALGEEELFEEVDAANEPTASDLIYCPGWSPTLESSGLDAVIVPGSGVPDIREGFEAERFDLDVTDLAAIGLAPEDGRGVEVSRFRVWIAAEQPWVVGVELQFAGDSAAMEDALGPGFERNADVEITVSFSIVALNDPGLDVRPPSDEERPPPGSGPPDR